MPTASLHLHPTTLACRVLNDETEVTRLADEWRVLQAESGRLPFTDYAWFDCWWQHIGKPAGKKLHVITGRVDGKLVAVLPLAVRSRMGFRILQNAGEETGHPCDMLLASPIYAEAMWKATRQSRGYDFAILRTVEAGSVCEKSLDGFAQKFNADTALYLKLTDYANSDAWLTSLSHNTRRNHLRRMRRLKETGNVTFTVTSKLDKPLIEEMLAQKKAWCESNGKRGIFDHAGWQGFFHGLLQHAAENGNFRLFRLAVDDKTLGYRAAIIHGGVLYSYVVSYSPTAASYSPGNIINVNSTIWAMEQGLREINLMQGETTSKLAFSNGSRDYHDWMFSPSLAGHAKANLYILYWTLQRSLMRGKAGKDSGD
jgi:CelD/BcsL family acetyltransferase involved in cellulose biosynthesis